MSEVLAVYERALVRAGAKVTLTDSDELSFEVGLKESANFNIKQVDIGLVTRGTLVVEPTAHGYRVRLSGKPRTWLLILGILPWLAIPWAVGIAPAPWAWLLAFGGMPLLVLLWSTVWTNLSAFVEQGARPLITAGNDEPVQLPARVP